VDEHLHTTKIEHDDIGRLDVGPTVSCDKSIVLIDEIFILLHEMALCSLNLRYRWEVSLREI